MNLTKPLSTLLITLSAASLLSAQPYYRDGNGDGSPSYPINVDASDADGDLSDVTLFFRVGFGFEQKIAENTTAESTGVDQLVIDHDMIYEAAPGSVYQFRAEGVDMSGLDATVSESVTVGDRTPTAAIPTATGGGTFNLLFQGMANDDFDLDQATLEVRSVPSGDPMTGSFTPVDLGDHSPVISGAAISAPGTVVASGETDLIKIGLTYTPTERNYDYQFRFTIVDAPEGDGALSDTILSGILTSASAEVIINSIAFPKTGYEAWFETSDLKRETFEVE
jgi:hypothetical protein